jgi:hypothetical protein
MYKNKRKELFNLFIAIRFVRIEWYGLKEMLRYTFLQDSDSSV